MTKWLLLFIPSLVFGQTLSIPTHLDSVVNASNHTTLVSNTIAPASDVLLIAVVAGRGVNPASISMSTTLSNVGSWTTIGPIFQLVNLSAIFLSYAVVNGAPGSGTITASWTGTQVRGVMEVVSFTGFNRSAPIVQSKLDTASTSTTPSLTLSALQTGSKSFAAVNSRNGAGTTPGTNETELSETSSGGTSPARLQSEYGTDTVLDWSTLGALSNAAVAIEIAVARKKVIIVE